MKEQDKVICINDDFPFIEKYSTSKNTNPITPKKGDELIIDEVLGDFLRFELFDSVDSFNWWHKSRFRKIEESFCEEEAIHKLTNPLTKWKN